MDSFIFNLHLSMVFASIIADDPCACELQACGV
jgi:hypothetical protein